ncbi:protein FAM210A-like [Centruroides sculpturatus]|uniref:protein FAM210A-like n=1 Tax=Centruroides sculpturatus TaxID=218467 RepID=UPI000C6CFBF9|nr:protein FAM210A-like [Centruroides sculpturatus]
MNINLTRDMSCYLLNSAKWSVIYCVRRQSNRLLVKQISDLSLFKLQDRPGKFFHYGGRGLLFRQMRITSNDIRICSQVFQYQISRTLENKPKHKLEKEEELAENANEEKEEKKMSLVQRYKTMLKEYWYVLIPVHVATSLVWFGSFYYVAKSGFDIVPYLEAVGFSEQFLEPLKNSSLGYLAVASAIYKLATPARYMVTIGGTTFAVKYLTKRNYIKPMKDIKTMIQQRRKGS